MNTNADQSLEFIFGRRSIRQYSAAPVSEAAVQKLLEAAMAAPSAAAKDPWRFVVIRNRQTLSAIAAALPNGQMIATAALGVAVCGDLEAAHDQQLSYLLQDCSAAIENLLLGVHVLGLGACWLGAPCQLGRELLPQCPCILTTQPAPPVACDDRRLLHVGTGVLRFLDGGRGFGVGFMDRCDCIVGSHPRVSSRLRFWFCRRPDPRP